MDRKMTALNQSNIESNINHAEEHTQLRTARSASHGRTHSISGIRSKIPMNINHNRPPPSIMNAQISPCTQDDSTSSITPGNTTRRLTRSYNSALSKSRSQCTPGGMQKRWLESQFKKEKKQYLIMKKELYEKQKCAQQMFNEMRQLREKLIADGGKDPGKIEEIKIVFNHCDKQSGDQTTCRVPEDSFFVDNKLVDQGFISAIENKLNHYSKDYLSICENMLGEYSKVLKWMEDCDELNGKLGRGMSQHIDNYKRDADILNKRLESGKKLAGEFNIGVMKNVKTMWAEIEALRSRTEHLESMGDDAVNELRVKLNTEMEKSNHLKEIKTMVDNELIKSKLKVQALETRVDADEAKMGQLQSHIKNLESQLKQKDVNFEHSTRDLHKSLKHSEETIVCLETQRDDLQSRLNEMENNLETENKRRIDKSPRVQAVAQHLTEDDNQRYRDTKEEVRKLETLVEALRGEVVSSKEFIVKLQNENSWKEIQFKEKLAKEQAQSTKSKENFEQLREEHESIPQKTKAPDNQVVSYRDDYESKNIKKDLGTTEFVQSIEDLCQEVSDLKRKNKDLETQLQQQLKNLEIKNQMIVYLKAAHSDGTNPNAHQVDNEIHSKAEVLQELYSTLEKKQMQVTHLESLVKQMEGQEMRNQEQRTRYEKRISQLEVDAQMRKNRDCRYVMDFSIPHSSRRNEIAKALELERKYQKLKKESWQMENIYNKLIESTIRSVESRDAVQNSRGSCRDKEYTCRSPEELKRVNVGCYAHQVVDQCGRELSGGINSTGRQKDRCRNRVPHRIIGRKLSSKREFINHIHK